MWNKPYRKSDVEADNSMLECPELQWAFIRKVYSIITFQFLLTIVVAAIVVKTPRVAHFFAHTGTGLGLYIVILIMPLFVLILLYYYQASGELYPAVDFHHLACFGRWIKLFVYQGRGDSGISDSDHGGYCEPYSVHLLGGAARRGHDFNFLGPFLFGAVVVLVLFGFIQIFFPMGRISMMIYGDLSSIIFCGYIIYDTDNLIKRFSYDEYIWATVSLYLDIINLFLSLLTIFSAADS